MLVLHYFRRSKLGEGCSDTRLAAEPVPRVNADRLMMPLVHHISTMGQGYGYAGIKVSIGRLSTTLPPQIDCNNLRIDTSDIQAVV